MVALAHPRYSPAEDATSSFPGRPSVNGTYLDEVLMMRNAAGTKYYYHANHLYSVHAVTNQSGAIVEAVSSYDAYGKPTIITGAGTDATWFTGDDVVGTVSAIGNPWFYTGQRLDVETGLFYYKNRYYSAELGRFISRDPIKFMGNSWNLYEYVGSMPTYYFDPKGLKLFVEGNAAYRTRVQTELNNLCPQGKWQVRASGRVKSTVPGFCDDEIQYIVVSKGTCQLTDGGVVVSPPVIVPVWVTRSCGESSLPKACCCICDLINAWRKIKIGAAVSPDTWKTTWVAITGEHTRVKTDFGSNVSVEVTVGGKDVDQIIPDWLALGHELCGHALNFDRGGAAIRIENELRAERNPPLPPRTGTDH